MTINEALSELQEECQPKDIETEVKSKISDMLLGECALEDRYLSFLAYMTAMPTSSIMEEFINMAMAFEVGFRIGRAVEKSSREAAELEGMVGL